jgi:hypothetical protein
VVKTGFISQSGTVGGEAMKRQACWHSGHAYLLSFLTKKGFRNRVEFIKTNKPKNERKLRLRLFKAAKGRLPVGLVKAEEAVERAYAAWVKAYAAWVKAKAAWDKAEEAVERAYAAWVKAYAAWVKAKAAWDKAYALALPALEVLHAKECKNCPWDGETIFPKGKP